jgi:hypothetical protein
MKLPTCRDLRARFDSWNLPPRRQGKRPTCSVFAVAGALEYALAARQDRGIRLSVEFLNWAGHRSTDRTADGGFFSELWDGFAADGICPEATLPYRARYEAALDPGPAARAAARAYRDTGFQLHWIKRWDVATGLSEAELTAIRATIAAGWPVCGGLRWPRGAGWRINLLQGCAPEKVYDGHSVLLVGYRDHAADPGGGLLWFRNSAGDGRDGEMSYAYAAAYMNDAAWIGG